MVLYDHNKRSYVRIYDLEKALKGDGEPVKEIAGPSDHLITQVSWGPLNQTLYISTDKGKMILHDIEAENAVVT